MQIKYCIIFIFFILINTIDLEAYMMHHVKPDKEWKEENLPPFDELILSWNGIRPIEGKHFFYIRVKIHEWSSWFLYAVWGKDNQSCFLTSAPDAHIRIYQDTLEVLEGKKATAFEIKIVQEGNASLDNIRHLHVYTNSDQDQEKPMIAHHTAIKLPVSGLSQIEINHPRNKDFCSPTSTTAVIRYLLHHSTLDPLDFSQHAWDSGFDIYGNWILNVAQASLELGDEWTCWVERLSGFDAVIQKLHKGTPVIASVRGPLKGSAFPYSTGHLLVIIGYDPEQQKVICMDPAFPTNYQTEVCYDQLDFFHAWSRRGNIAYIFNKHL